MNILDVVDAASLRKDIPQFRAGDELKIHVRVIEGNKSRLQVFVNGVLQREGDTKAYLVTGPNQITFNQGLQADDELSIYSFV